MLCVSYMSIRKLTNNILEKKIMKKDQLKSDQVVFNPYVGINYEYGITYDRGNSLVFGTKANPGKKVLVLGESHHCEEGDVALTFTSDVMDWYLKAEQAKNWERWMNTFEKFERSIVGDYTDKSMRQKLWNSVMFYNYLQVPMDGPRKAATTEQYQQAGAPFFKILEKYQPECVIVWGRRLWLNLPDDDRWEEGNHSIMPNEDIWNGSYRLSNGKIVNALSVYHPSCGYSWDYWHRIIRCWLNSH